VAPSADDTPGKKKKTGHTMRLFKEENNTQKKGNRKREKDIKRREPDRIGGVRRRQSRGVAVDVGISDVCQLGPRREINTMEGRPKKKKHNQ
jgi:hypothetical protein